MTSTVHKLGTDDQIDCMIGDDGQVWLDDGTTRFCLTAEQAKDLGKVIGKAEKEVGE